LHFHPLMRTTLLMLRLLQKTARPTLTSGALLLTVQTTSVPIASLLTVPIMLVPTVRPLMAPTT